MVTCQLCGRLFRPENSSHIYHSVKCRKDAAKRAFDMRHKDLVQLAQPVQAILSANQSPAEALSAILQGYSGEAGGYRLGGQTQKKLRRGYEPRLRWFPAVGVWSLDEPPVVPEAGQYLLALYDSTKQLLSLPKHLVFVARGSRVSWTSAGNTYQIFLNDR